MANVIQNKRQLAIKDCCEGIQNWRIWLLFAWQDIRLKYRRSTLGPFWLTLSMAITIYSLGFLYGHLFKMDYKQYFPFVAIGYVLWNFLSLVINETTNTFIDAAGYLKQIKLSYITFVLRVVAKNLIIFLHNVVAVIPVIWYCFGKVEIYAFFSLLSLLFLLVNSVIYGMILAIIGARFRDIPQLIASVMQVIFFITPVMWMPKILPVKYYFLIQLNPFARIIEAIRAPLLNNFNLTALLYDYLYLTGFTFFGLILLLIIFSKTRNRIIYWI